MSRQDWVELDRIWANSLEYSPEEMAIDIMREALRDLLDPSLRPVPKMVELFEMLEKRLADRDGT